MDIYIYINIYVCVCVCVCIYIHTMSKTAVLNFSPRLPHSGKISAGIRRWEACLTAVRVTGKQQIISAVYSEDRDGWSVLAQPLG